MPELDSLQDGGGLRSRRHHLAVPVLSPRERAIRFAQLIQQPEVTTRTYPVLPGRSNAYEVRVLLRGRVRSIATFATGSPVILTAVEHDGSVVGRCPGCASQRERLVPPPHDSRRPCALVRWQCNRCRCASAA